MGLTVEFVQNCNNLLNNQVNYPQTIQTPEDKAQMEQQVAEITAILSEINAKCISPEDNDLIKVLRGSFDTLLGNALQQLNNFNEALNALENAYDRLKDTSGLAAAKMYYHYGWILHTLKRYAEAENHYKTSLSLYQQQGETLYIKEIADIHNNLGRTYDLRNMLEEATNEYLTAIELKKSLPESLEARDSLANTYNNLAWIKQKKQSLQEAHDLYANALRIASPSAGQLRGTIYNNLAEVCSELTRYWEAKDYFKKALGLKREVHGQDSDKVAFTLNAYASFLLLTSPEAAPKALKMLQEAQRIYTKIFLDKPQHPDLLKVKANIEKANQVIGDLTDFQSAADHPNSLFAARSDTRSNNNEVDRDVTMGPSSN